MAVNHLALSKQQTFIEAYQLTPTLSDKAGSQGYLARSGLS